MTNNKSPKKSNLPIIAGITGAVVAAGAAVAGTLFLKDKKNRDKIKKVAEEVKDTAQDYVHQAEKDIKKIVATATGKKPVIKNSKKKVSAKK